MRSASSRRHRRAVVALRHGVCGGHLNSITPGSQIPVNPQAGACVGPSTGGRRGDRSLCFTTWTASVGPGRRRRHGEAVQMTETIWSPTAARIEGSALRAYLDWLEQREGRPFPDHDALWAWSVEDLDRFWISIVEYY